MTYTGITLLPYALYFHLRWLRGISFRVLLPAFSLALAFVFPITPQAQIVSLYVAIDDVNSNSINVNRACHLSRTIRQKTGGGLSEVFAYVTCRVVMRCEWDEAHASGPVVGNGGTVRLADVMNGRTKAFLPGYCSS
jgi:hypothetical protein